MSIITRETERSEEEQASTGSSDTASLEPEIGRLRELQRAGRYGEALDDAERLGRDWPENRDLLLIAAGSLRYLGRVPEALAALDCLERVHPRFSQLHQERGLCHVALKDAPRAIDALLRAVNINPALPSSWSMLERLYRLTEDAQNASTAAAHVAKLKDLPPDVVRATSLFSDGDLGPAEKIIRAFLLRHGDHPEAMRLLAKIGIEHDVLDDAELLLETVLALAPDFRAARYDYARTLVLRQKHVQARAEIEHLRRLEPNNWDYRSLAATAAVGLGEHEQAIAIYREMLAENPAVPDVHLWIGHALKTVGRHEDAVAAYRTATAVRPDFGDAYWSLANLKTYRLTDEELERITAADATPKTTMVDRYHLSFALGKALEDRGNFEASFRAYERGNALKRAESRYRPELIERNTAAQTRVCPAEFFAARADFGSPSAEPIFIVGLPRSGSTLVEQILASHSEVEGTQELPDIPRIVLDLQGRDPDLDNPRYPDALTDLKREDFLALAERYLSDTRVYRSGKPRFIDKMPNNFRHIGLIHLMFPNAKIIDARREPMACCFGNLKQLFARGQEFAYSIDDIARYYRTYLDVMAHWDAALPGRVLHVIHEDVVGDLEGNVRRILDFCGLAFEPACVAFHKTARAVRTASSEQVRRPLYREGLDQWRHFEPWLRPLREALGDALARWRE